MLTVLSLLFTALYGVSFIWYREDLFFIQLPFAIVSAVFCARLLISSFVKLRNGERSGGLRLKTIFSITLFFLLPVLPDIVLTGVTLPKFVMFTKGHEMRTEILTGLVAADPDVRIASARQFYTQYSAKVPYLNSSEEFQIYSPSAQDSVVREKYGTLFYGDSHEYLSEDYFTGITDNIFFILLQILVLILTALILFRRNEELQIAKGFHAYKLSIRSKKLFNTLNAVLLSLVILSIFIQERVDLESSSLLHWLVFGTFILLMVLFSLSFTSLISVSHKNTDLDRKKRNGELYSFIFIVGAAFSFYPMSAGMVSGANLPIILTGSESIDGVLAQRLGSEKPKLALGAAKVLFHSYGVQLHYRGESGDYLRFEPSRGDIASKEEIMPIERSLGESAELLFTSYLKQLSMHFMSMIIFIITFVFSIRKSPEKIK